MCGRAYFAPLSVDVAQRAHQRDGGDQAVGVLATVKRDGIELKRRPVEHGGRRSLQGPHPPLVRRPGPPYYATARLWDDGVIDPADTRRVLALGLAASRNAPIEDTKFGLFRT